jgi:6-phosphogluconolactonase
VARDENNKEGGRLGMVAAREFAPNVLVCANAEAVARGAARLFVEWAWQAVARDGNFFVALSGGKTPEAFFRVLASSEYRAQVDWPRVQLFWGDERPVPPESDQSNYGMARRELLIRVPIPGGNVHRMEAEKNPIGRAAQEYEELLRETLPLDERGFPRFHVIFLGLGVEGHTASLFPGQRGMRDTSRWVSTPNVPQVNSKRMTLTLPVINAAQRVLFLVEGPEKAGALFRVVADSGDPPVPAQLVKPINGVRTVLCDESAASEILVEIQKHGKLPSPSAKGIRNSRTR